MDQRAKEILRPYEGQKIKVYITGLSALMISVLNTAYELSLSVEFLHYDEDTEEYFTQDMDEDISKCARKTLCEIESFERSILEAVQEKKCLEDWTEKNDIKIRYADIFDGDKIRENMWTSKQLAKNLKEGKYESFLKMVSFFAEAAPLSALGYHFLRRL